MEKTASNVNHENTNFCKSPAEGIEKFFESLERFPFQKYKQVDHFITIAQQNNHLLIMVGVVCVMFHASLQYRFNYSPLQAQKITYVSKNHGKFRWQYIFPGYLVNKKLIINIKESQSKRKNLTK